MATEEVQEKGFTNFSVSIQNDLLGLLDRLAAEKKLNRSQFIRQIFGQYLHDMTQKFHPPLAGIFADSSGQQTFVGLASEMVLEKVRTGEWHLVKEF
jgi:hypothetical protein